MENGKLLRRKKALEILRMEIEEKIPDHKLSVGEKELMVSQLEKSSIDLDPFTREEEKFRKVVEGRINSWMAEGEGDEKLTKRFERMFTVFTKKHRFWNSLNLTHGLVGLITLFIAVVSLVILIWEKATMNGS